MVSLRFKDISFDKGTNHITQEDCYINILRRKRMNDTKWLKTVQDDYGMDEFLDFYEIAEFGATKHGRYNFLEPNGSKCSKKDMYASVFRHVAQASTGGTLDEDTDEHPILHAIFRLQILYLRHKRGIKHDDD